MKRERRQRQIIHCAIGFVYGRMRTASHSDSDFINKLQSEMDIGHDWAAFGFYRVICG